MSTLKITVPPLTDCHYTGAVTLRVYYARPFIDDAGNQVMGGPVGSSAFFVEYPCSLAAGVLTVPDLVLTTSDQVRAHLFDEVQVSAVFFRGSTQLDYLFQDFILPKIFVPQVSLSDLTVWNDAMVLTYPSRYYLDRNQILTLLRTFAAPQDATYITQVPNAGLGAEQALSTLATGILKNNTGTGVLTIAVPGTDYIVPGPVGSLGIGMNSSRLLGRTTVGFGPVEEIQLGTNLSFAGNVLNATGGSGGGVSPNPTNNTMPIQRGGVFVDSRITDDLSSLTLGDLAAQLSLYNVLGTATISGTAGVGVGQLEITNLNGRHLRLNNVSHHAEMNLGAGGIVELDAVTGSINFHTNPLGNQIDPRITLKENLGQLTKKYNMIHAGELWVETLVAQNTIATIGGRILVGPTTMLVLDIPASTSANVIRVNHNQLNSAGVSPGDIVLLQGGGFTEFMQVLSTPTPVVVNGITYYDYTVTRDYDGTGPNAWLAGDAVFSTGKPGNGFIDLYSISGVSQSASGTMVPVGPTIVGNIRNTTVYNDWSEHWAIGNLQGVYGYGSVAYGVGLGQFANGVPHITIDSNAGVAGGIRIFKGLNTVIGQWDASGNITVGQTIAGQGNTVISSTGLLQLRTGTIVRIELRTGGDGFLANNTVWWDTAGNFHIDNSATIGGWVIGPTTISGTGIVMTSGVNANITAGGLTILDANGIRVKSSTNFAPNRAYEMVNEVDGLLLGALYDTVISTTEHVMFLAAQAVTGRSTDLFLSCAAPAGNHTWTKWSMTVGGTEVGSLQQSDQFGFRLNTNAVQQLSVSNSGNFSLDGLTGAFLPNRLTTAQRNAITPANSMLIYNTSSGKLELYCPVVGGGSNWIPLLSSGDINGSMYFPVGANTFFHVPTNGAAYGIVWIDDANGSSCVSLQASQSGSYMWLNIKAGATAGGLQLYGIIQMESQNNSNNQHGVFQLISEGTMTRSSLFASVGTFGGLAIGASIIPAAGVVLQLESTTGALLLPRMTQAQVTAVPGTDGMLLYNSGRGTFQGRSLGQWRDLMGTVTVKVSNSAATVNIPPNGSGPINFDHAWFDTDGMWNSGAMSRLTCKVAGVYLIECAFTINGDGVGTGIRQLQILYNNAKLLITDICTHPSPTTGENLQANVTWNLNVGDFVLLQIYQNSGVNLSVNGSNGATDYSGIYFSMTKIG